MASSAITSDGRAMTSTLLGRLALHEITYDSEQKLHVRTSWNAQVNALAKVNALALSNNWLVVGGIRKDGKGAVEVWSRLDVADPTAKMSELAL